MVSPGAEQLWGDADRHSSSLILGQFCTPKAPGWMRNRPWGRARQYPEAAQKRQPQRPGPRVAYQPRFRQSKVMTPFSSGVHLMPGEKKASLSEAASESGAEC